MKSLYQDGQRIYTTRGGTKRGKLQLRGKKPWPPTFSSPGPGVHSHNDPCQRSKFPWDV